MKLKIGLFGILIIVSLFFACSKDKEKSSSGEDTAEQSEFIIEDNFIDDVTHTPAAAEGYDYSKILKGDFSELAGTWVNISGNRIKFNAQGSFNEGYKASSVMRSDNSSYGTGIYQWGVNSEPDADGFSIGWGVILFPVGVDVKEGDRIFQSNTEKVRIALVQHDFAPAYQLYYREEISPVLNAQELRVGSFINGNMSTGQGIWYSVRTSEIGLLTIDVDSRIDTYLEAYDRNLDLIKRNDDWDGINPKVEFLSEANAVYYIRFNGYGENISGAFRIMASHKPMVITDLRSGSHRGSIENGKDYWFSVRTNGIGILDIHTTGNINTYMELYNKDFELFDADNESGINSNAQIKMDVRPDQIFYIKLRAVISGQYEITAQFNSYPAPVTLAPNAFIDSSIQQGDEHWYSVRITRKDFDYLILETSGNADVYFEVFNSSYMPVNFNSYYSYISIDIFNVNAGTVYFIRLKCGNSGSYRILASEINSL